jgi:protein involved in polysaccharide export with SLBB domain
MKRQNLRNTLVIFVLLFVAGCGAGGGLPPLEGGATAPEYTLGSGDQVRVTVFNEPQFSGEYTVDGSGHVAMPMIGGVSVDGLTVPAAENAIAEELSEKALVSPDVSVEVVNYRPFYILGEVRAPGQYPYVDDMTVLTAIAIAGGLTYRAETDRFSIIREKGGQAVEWAAERNSIVRPGDVITVFERYF